jgi:hypothetical protein
LTTEVKPTSFQKHVIDFVRRCSYKSNHVFPKTCGLYLHSHYCITLQWHRTTNCQCCVLSNKGGVLNKKGGVLNNARPVRADCRRAGCLVLLSNASRRYASGRVPPVVAATTAATTARRSSIQQHRRTASGRRQCLWSLSRAGRAWQSSSCSASNRRVSTTLARVGAACRQLWHLRPNVASLHLAAVWRNSGAHQQQQQQQQQQQPLFPQLETLWALTAVVPAGVLC